LKSKKLGPYGLPEIIELLGPPPLLRGEKKADFFCLIVALADDYDPVLACEWLLIHQIAVVTFQLQRFARAEAGLFTVLQDLPGSKTKVLLGDFTPRSHIDGAYNKPPSLPPPPPPRVVKPRGKERAATNSELGATLERRIDVLERSQDVAGELERRRTRLLRRLAEMQIMRVTRPEKIIDVTPEKE
jgi:hypothetical protein